MRNYSLIIGGEVSRYVKGGSRTRHPRPRGVSPGLHFGPVGVAGGQLKTCVRACVRTCVRAFVRACVRGGGATGREALAASEWFSRARLIVLASRRPQLAAALEAPGL